MNDIKFDDWQLLTSPSDLSVYLALHHLQVASPEPKIKAFPCLVRHSVSGACDDNVEWFILTQKDAEQMAYFLSQATKLLKVLSPR